MFFEIEASLPVAELKGASKTGSKPASDEINQQILKNLR